MSLSDSYSNVEKVVYAPVKPTATMRRKSSGRNQEPGPASQRSERTVENQPRNKLPEMLIRNVPHGNAEPSSRAAPAPTPHRASPPSADPNATRPIWISNRMSHSFP